MSIWHRLTACTRVGWWHLLFVRFSFYQDTVRANKCNLHLRCVDQDMVLISKNKLAFFRCHKIRAHSVMLWDLHMRGNWFCNAVHYNFFPVSGEFNPQWSIYGRFWLINGNSHFHISQFIISGPRKGCDISCTGGDWRHTHCFSW